MPIQLGGYTFPENTAACVEKHEETGGKAGRTLRISGLFTGHASRAALEAELDAVLAAASESNPDTALSLRPGRRLWVRRTAFERQVQQEETVGAFMLTLKAEDPTEESEAAVSELWNITHSGASLAVNTSGNRFSMPDISLTAVGSVVNPSFSDGTRTLQWFGVVGNGQTLLLEAATRRVLLDGEDQSWHSRGEFPRITPGGTTLHYTDAPFSSHTAEVTVTFRDRWW